MPPLPSYGYGREHRGPRYGSLIHGQNLRDVEITGQLIHRMDSYSFRSSCLNFEFILRCLSQFQLFSKVSSSNIVGIKFTSGL